MILLACIGPILAGAATVPERLNPFSRQFRILLSERLYPSGVLRIRHVQNKVVVELSHTQLNVCIALPQSMIDEFCMRSCSRVQLIRLDSKYKQSQASRGENT
jgi:hypothetical protein